MLELDQTTLRRLQLTELEMLLEIDRVCKKNGIRYTIIAGTMLGAVRHGDFIPWDDDADVAMTRDQYELFREACERDLDHERFSFQDDRLTPGYRWGYGKLRRNGTLFLREHQEHMPYDQGVFVDVFPLDPVPNSHLGRIVWNVRCWAVRKVLWSRVGKLADKSAFRRGIYSLLDRIPEERALGWFNGLVGRASRTTSEWVRILMFPTPNREYGYLRKWYDSTKPATFCGFIFPGVSDADEYLSFKFGDYMTLPPQSQRKTHPVSDIHLLEEVDA